MLKLTLVRGERITLAYPDGAAGTISLAGGARRADLELDFPPGISICRSDAIVAALNPDGRYSKLCAALAELTKAKSEIAGLRARLAATSNIE